MPSSVALWCGGFDEAFADAVEGLATAKRRIDKNPLGSAAGYGTPGLPLDRSMTTTSLESRSLPSRGYGCRASRPLRQRENRSQNVHNTDIVF